jgi:hypothetical protein
VKLWFAELPHSGDFFSHEGEAKLQISRQEGRCLVAERASLTYMPSLLDANAADQERIW